MINRIIKEIKVALDNECYMVALMSALTLPDACGRAEYGDIGTAKRYKEWCKQYVCENEKATDAYGYDMPYLSADTVYSLRNALLHQATPDINTADIKDERCKVEEFALVITDKDDFDSGTVRVSYGKNYEIVDRMQTISIRHLCNILCKAAEDYYADNRDKFSFIQYKLLDKRMNKM